MEKILLSQFIAHIMADYFAQSECISRMKQEKALSSWHLYIHVLIVFVFSLLLTPVCSFIGYAVVIALTHFMIDVLKSSLERWLKKKKGFNDRFYVNHYLFFTDQLLHLIVLYGVVSFFWTRNQVFPSYLELFSVNQLLIFTGFLLCMKPANVVIRICLASLNLYASNEKESGNDLEKAGRWIGTIERILTLVLVMLQQYAAIGFIIAAKSILRYNDSKTGKAEYVLIGTLLSFGIAVCIGIGIKQGIFESFLEPV
ncbi:DUF3307 domain-containing protein [Massilibacteroides sp.]|uniref:DUF3307 domain-containing protein n=1 Tax=Massilibacteroides sp. TaxID=2034766 RepID=UPI00263A09F4|nr:DUF3307 domain-containing protein [Massilibacteroides sp.]MDD4516704.1 DUF3307 domain-containing protein [Massilibacteroides sp.]